MTTDATDAAEPAIFSEEAVSVADARERLAELVDRAERDGTRTIVLKDGKPLAAIVSMEDLERLEVLEDEADNRYIDARRSETPVPFEDAVKRLGL